MSEKNLRIESREDQSLADRPPKPIPPNLAPVPRSFVPAPRNGGSGMGSDLGTVGLIVGGSILLLVDLVAGVPIVPDLTALAFVLWLILTSR